MNTHHRPRSSPNQTCTSRRHHPSPPSPSADDASVDTSVHTSANTSVASQDSPLPPSIRAVRDSTVPSPRARTLVICLDGTGDKFDGDNSNVVNFVACLKKDSAEQVTYYQSGIGTYDGRGLKGGLSAAVDMAVGSGLGIHIQDAYRFLMQTYREGDRICLFGFSRGSYTARCLAGMLHKVGLLPAHNMAQVNFAYTFYKNSSAAGWAMSAAFKRTFCIDVSVYFVGVWDCVASVGFIPRKLPFGKSATNSIRYFRHAMALDEHRAKFKICQYAHADPAAPSARARARAQRDEGAGRARRIFGACFGPKPSPGPAPADLPPSRADERRGPRTDIAEVWFAGCHADVGGGAVPNGARHALSRIPLRWMLRQCFECDTGIRFSTVALARTGLDVPALWPRYAAPPPPPTPATPTPLDLRPEQVEDHFDALCPLNDQLALARLWWALEFWPVKVRVQRREDAAWEKRVRMNLGRYRAVRELEPKMHWTVATRVREGSGRGPGGTGPGKGVDGYRIRNVVDRDARWVIAV
ncbi:unnamed protein product [Diplocarpon coronariae]